MHENTTDQDRTGLRVTDEGVSIPEHRRRSYGTAYCGMPGLANLDGLVRDDWVYLVTVTDGRGDEWITTLAHEAKHIEQYKAGRRGSEPPARAFATWAAERWKRT